MVIYLLSSLRPTQSVVSIFSICLSPASFGPGHSPVYSSDQQTLRVVRACSIAISSHWPVIPVSMSFLFFFLLPNQLHSEGSRSFFPGGLQLTGGMEVNVMALGNRWSQLAEPLRPSNTMPYSFVLLI